MDAGQQDEDKAKDWDDEGGDEDAAPEKKEKSEKKEKKEKKKSKKHLKR